MRTKTESKTWISLSSRTQESKGWKSSQRPPNFLKKVAATSIDQRFWATTTNATLSCRRLLLKSSKRKLSRQAKTCLLCAATHRTISHKIKYYRSHIIGKSSQKCQLMSLCRNSKDQLQLFHCSPSTTCIVVMSRFALISTHLSSHEAHHRSFRALSLWSSKSKLTPPKSAS